MEGCTFYLQILFLISFPMLADSFAQKSSSSNYSPKFQKFQQQKEKRKINFKLKNEEAYNKAFTLKEFKSAL